MYCTCATFRLEARMNEQQHIPDVDVILTDSSGSSSPPSSPVDLSTNVAAATNTTVIYTDDNATTTIPSATVGLVNSSHRTGCKSPSCSSRRDNYYNDQLVATAGSSIEEAAADLSSIASTVTLSPPNEKQSPAAANKDENGTTEDGGLVAAEDNLNLVKIPSSLDLCHYKDSRIYSSPHQQTATSPCPWSRNYYSTPLHPRFKLLKEGDRSFASSPYFLHSDMPYIRYTVVYLTVSYKQHLDLVIVSLSSPPD